jgi:phosphoribosylformylglycinamidine cyclo-ligase
LNKKNSPITYSSSGVDIEKGNQLVEEIKPIIRETKVPGADIEIGGFGGLFDIMKLGFNDPLLVSSTDGVGTKLLLAIESNNVSGVGIDLVAMCVNDLIVQGAQPLFFLDYFATGILSKTTAKEVIKSIADGCIQSKCALIGGETAEMPGFYDENHFDLAGFAVGAVERKNLLPKEVKVNDDIIGLKSSGVHSNGFSLVRKILDVSKTQLDSNTPFNEFTFSEELLKPTRIYVKTIISLLNKTNAINAIAHITGGGITENLPRVFSSGKVQAEIYKDSWEKPEIFHWLQNAGNIEESEMLKTFNCGIGMILIVNPKETNNLLNKLKELGEEPSLIGKIIHNENPETLVVYK